MSTRISHDWRADSVTYGPYIGISHADTEIDGFSERMSNPTAVGSGWTLFVDEQDVESLMTKLGAVATFTWQGP